VLCVANRQNIGPKRITDSICVDEPANGSHINIGGTNYSACERLTMIELHHRYRDYEKQTKTRGCSRKQRYLIRLQRRERAKQQAANPGAYYPPSPHDYYLGNMSPAQIEERNVAEEAADVIIEREQLAALKGRPSYQLFQLVQKYMNQQLDGSIAALQFHVTVVLPATNTNHYESKPKWERKWLENTDECP
jgi:hypothetical protein